MDRRAIVHACMSEFRRGALRTGSGTLVLDRVQALAIGLKVAADQAPPARELASPRVERALQIFAEVDPQLAAKVQPAGRKQLALFHQADAPAEQGDHTWIYLGREKPTIGNGSVYQCARCSVTKRVERRGQRTVTKYAADGERYGRQRMPCAANKEGA